MTIDIRCVVLGAPVGATCYKKAPQKHPMGFCKPGFVNLMNSGEAPYLISTNLVRGTSLFYQFCFSAQADHWVGVVQAGHDHVSDHVVRLQVLQ